MYWIVLSDTHGNSSLVLDIVDKEADASGFIHLGDMASDMEHAAIVAERPVIQVAGNCDIGSDLPRERELLLGKDRFLLTHGHLYGVKGGLHLLAARAMKCGCPFVLYGHTHIPAISTIGTIRLFNPGTLQSAASNRSYARMHLEPTGPRFVLISL